jgi:hypothetical protein
MPRDPRKSPLPGDALMTPNGCVYRVLDRFVAVNGQGVEHAGVYCSVENEEGEERDACIAMSVFTAKMAQAEIIEQAGEEDADWASVPRIPNERVLAEMRRTHGYD